MRVIVLGSHRQSFTSRLEETVVVSPSKLGTSPNTRINPTHHTKPKVPMMDCTGLLCAPLKDDVNIFFIECIFRVTFERCECEFLDGVQRSAPSSDVSHPISLRRACKKFWSSAFTLQVPSKVLVLYSHSVQYCTDVYFVRYSTGTTW